uniref:TPR_REGION domain-containing protein n=1 Tax=Rhabditophanes sp. KR3021 TaxID=114890 RepID=A0AC35TTF4_9BILA
MNNLNESFNDSSDEDAPIDFGLDDMFEDKSFQQALAKSSHGRRPTTASTNVSNQQLIAGKMGASRGGQRTESNLQTASRMRTSMMSRMGTSSGTGNSIRPMTAIKGAGYTSSGKRQTTIDNVQNPFTKEIIPKETQNEKGKQIEKQALQVLIESVMAYDGKDYKVALEKAKEAGRKDRMAVKLRENVPIDDPLNIDLTYLALFNLAQQYTASGMLNEALNTYQAITRNKMFPNAGKLKINIGNIYFRKKEYVKAIKYYRMALDQSGVLQQSMKVKLLNNIGVALIKLGKYESALENFEYAMTEREDYGTALNLILTAYCLDDADKMKDSFQKLVDIPTMIEDDKDYDNNVLYSNVFNNDTLKQWERKRKQRAETTILSAAKIISPAISSTFAEGYAWCVEAIKQSDYSSLANELEMNKALELLKRGELEAASEAYMVFNTKESKVASSAANNLAMISLMKGSPEDLVEAETFCKQALNFDRYNVNAYVSYGNIWFVKKEYSNALNHYREAINTDASCVQALFNMGLVYQKISDYQKALECYYKLNHMLINNIQVVTALGEIYTKMGNNEQAIELFSQANSLVPTDPNILNKLGKLYEMEGDVSQAFQCYYDSFRLYPSNINVIEWLGAYYIEAQYAEKAVTYFEKAALIEPNNIKWQLMTASCERRSGNFQRALSIYRGVHAKFPENVECLKYLVRVSTDLGLGEVKEYSDKLEKLEKMKLLREERDNLSSQGKRMLSAGSVNGEDSLNNSFKKENSFMTPSRSQRIDSAKNMLESDEMFVPSSKSIDDRDLRYNDPVGPEMERPKTGKHIPQNMNDIFEFDEIDDNLLPD